MKAITIASCIIVYYFFINKFGYDLGSMDAFWGAMIFIFIPIVGIPLITSGIVDLIDQGVKIKNIEENINKKGFEVTEKIQCGDIVLFADGKSSKLCIAQYRINDSKILNYPIFEAGSLLSSKIIEGENEEITSISTGSVMGRALVGGLLLGGVGAVVGGITAKTVSKRNIKSLELRIIVDNQYQSSYRIKFFNNETGLPVTSPRVKSALEEIEKWQVIIELIMMKEKIPKFNSTYQLQDYIEYIRLKGRKNN